MKTNIFALPQFSRRFIPIWHRNFMVWKKWLALRCSAISPIR